MARSFETVVPLRFLWLPGLAIAAFTVLMGIKVWPYLGLEKGINFLTTKSEETNDSPLFRLGFYVHITSSLWVLAAGLVQFFPQWLGQRAPAWHRGLGKLYVGSILLLAAPSGLILALYANGGLASQVGFTMQCAVWFLATWQAYRMARQRNWPLHSEWMLRSYAVTLAAMSLRLESYLLYYVFDTRPIETYLTVTWLSWTGNLILVEIAISIGLSRWLLRQYRTALLPG